MGRWPRNGTPDSRCVVAPVFRRLRLVKQRIAIAASLLAASLLLAADKIGQDVLPFVCDTGKVDQVDAEATSLLAIARRCAR